MIDPKQACCLSYDKSISVIMQPLPEWASYRVDRKGTRLPKTVPPPQGTYKINEGLGKTDYSDPRDFYAPTVIEQQMVWQALRPTRESYYVLTTAALKMEEMRCLSLGYNASWDEIRRKFVNWCFLEHGPDSLDMSERGGEGQANQVWVPSAIPGYSEISTDVPRRRSRNNGNLNNGKHSQILFRNGELAVDPHKHLPKLRRWYGLIEDFYFSPSWKPPVRDSTGVYLQNPDAFACKHCRMSQVNVCYGHREHPDRKCAPCQMLKLKCSKEDDYDDGEDKVGNGMVPDVFNPTLPLPSDPAVIADSRKQYGPLSDYWRYPPGGLFGVFVKRES